MKATSRPPRPPARSASRHVALLRGINVGGKNKLPMAVLAQIFTDAGARDVRTYIQSGNVVFAANAALAKHLPGIVAQAISARLGLQVPVVQRSADELARAVRDNPFLRKGLDADALHLMFLAQAPSAAAVAALDPQRSPGDTFVVRGRDVYLHCPKGLAKTKLSNAYFDRALDTVSTVRNWRTVLALLELASAG